MSEIEWALILLLVVIGGLPFYALATVKVVDGAVWLICAAVSRLRSK